MPLANALAVGTVGVNTWLLGYEEDGTAFQRYAGSTTGGFSFLVGSGAPASGLGSVGNAYVNISTGELYTKTGVSTWTLEGNLTGPAGRGIDTLTFPASAAALPAANPAVLGARNSIPVLIFDSTTQQSARWVFVLPTGRTYSAGVTVVVHWCSNAATGTGRWGARIQRLTGVDINSDSFDTAVEAGTAVPGTAGTVVTTTLAPLGIDGAGIGELVQLEVYRDTGDAGDTVNADGLELVAVQLELPAA